MKITVLKESEIRGCGDGYYADKTLRGLTRLEDFMRKSKINSPYAKRPEYGIGMDLATQAVKGRENFKLTNSKKVLY